MDSAATTATTSATVFSTADVGSAGAFDRWQELVSDTFVPLHAGPVSAAPFRGVVEHRSVGDLQLTMVRAGAQEVRRTPALIARGGEEYVLASLQVTGTGLVEPRRSPGPAPPGFDGVLRQHPALPASI